MSKLPTMVHEFEINVIGEDTGQKFFGEFKYKRPNLGTRRQIKIMEDSLNNGSETLDDEIKAINLMVSWLHFTIIEYPTWWNGGLDLYDHNVILELYESIIKYEADFRKKIEKAGKEDAKDSKKTGRK